MIAGSLSDRHAPAAAAAHRIFQRSYRLHRLGYARETIAEIGSMGAVLATVHIGQTGS
jgi:hypothetical protein